ncbi:MAG TPA: HEAT repeat domain-containing protein, partial [Polyangiaceae bacterium]|nr:HEAT repeat domain-containing protein [Polyangiaceae bacterium]
GQGGLLAETSPAFARLVAKAPDFRTRYLLLGPAAAIARSGDRAAERFVIEATLRDADEHVRARAAEVAGELPEAITALESALRDKPRVRDAALVSIARLSDPRGKVQNRVWPATLFPRVAELLETEPFTFVRSHAADALVFAPAGESADGPLAKALNDASPTVRARAVESLGRRGALRHAGELRARLDDEDEILDVRVRAARALGRVCDASAASRLTELARKAASPSPAGGDLAIGASAAAALGRLRPPDLAGRLAPLSAKGASRIAQEIARVAFESTERCQ